MGALYVDASSMVGVVLTNVPVEGASYTFAVAFVSVGAYELSGTPAAIDSDGKPVQIDYWTKFTDRLFIKPNTAAAKITVSIQPTGA